VVINRPVGDPMDSQNRATITHLIWELFVSGFQSVKLYFICIGMMESR
jgi:hypothetical protein